jgi:hypothetical protein
LGLRGARRSAKIIARYAYACAKRLWGAHAAPREVAHTACRRGAGQSAGSAAPRMPNVGGHVRMAVGTDADVAFNEGVVLARRLRPAWTRGSRERRVWRERRRESGAVDICRPRSKEDGCANVLDVCRVSYQPTVRPYEIGRAHPSYRAGQWS